MSIKVKKKQVNINYTFYLMQQSQNIQHAYMVKLLRYFTFFFFHTKFFNQVGFCLHLKYISIQISHISILSSYMWLVVTICGYRQYIY